MSMRSVLRHLNILYAEDDDGVRTHVMRILKLLFGEIYVAKNGLEALELYNQKSVQIALLDYSMPIINGFEVAKFIRDGSDIPIIVVSGHTEKEKLLEAIELGVIKYIEKPVVYEELMSAFEQSVKKLEKLNLLKIRLTEELYYDFMKKAIIKNGDEIFYLTRLENEFIELFLNRPDNIVTKELASTIIKEGKYGKDGAEPAIRNIVYRLRKKLEVDFIHTVKDVGYAIGVPNNSDEVIN